MPHAIGVANGTDALVLVARRDGDRPGDEVICPSFTFYATAEAIAARRRDSGLRRHRPGDAQPRPRRRRRADHAADEGDHARAPVRPARAARRARPRSACPLIEDAAQAFGAAGIAHDRRRLDLQLLPDQEPLRPRRRRPVACTDDAVAERIRMLRFHGSRDKKHFESSATTRASTRSRRRRCGSSCRSSTAGTPPGARRPRATPSSASATLVELPADEPGHVYHMYVVPHARARPDRRRRCRRPGSAGRLLHDADPPPAGDALSRLRARRAARRRSVRPPRTSRCRCGPGSAPTQQERVVDDGPSPPSACASAAMRLPLTRHRSGSWPRTRRSSRSPGARLPVRFDGPRPGLLRPLSRLGRSSRSWWRSSSPSSSLFGFYNRWWRYVSTRDMWGAARGVLAASRRRLPRLRALRVHKAACRARSGSSTCCSAWRSSPARACSRAR